MNSLQALAPYSHVKLGFLLLLFITSTYNLLLHNISERIASTQYRRHQTNNQVHVFLRFCTLSTQILNPANHYLIVLHFVILALCNLQLLFWLCMPSFLNTCQDVQNISTLFIMGR
jgi:hypothetical protein